MAAREGKRYSVPAEPLRQRLVAAGTNSTEMQRATGGRVTSSAIWDLMHGKRTRVRLSTARLIEEALDNLESTFVPQIGAQRRIRALCAIGWDQTYQSEYSGISTRSLKRCTQITRRVHEAVCRMYEDLSMKPGPSIYSKAAAKANNWAPPLAWDDDALDDPDAKPYSGRDGKYDWQTDYEFLISCGESEEQALKKVGRKKSALDKRTERKRVKAA